jgi:pimeloyl-ACP methyl ester carboxylesterase
MADLGSVRPREIPVFLYHGTNDATAPVAHLDLNARAIPHAVVRRITGVDHQLNDDLSIVATDIRSLMPART